ncbi:glycosyltransferase family 2 protein [Aquimarina sp. 2304DJ70-9]|uniref:glycosyltransferase family 2 protein n=1 Tax=Aquimarina penaris TaxID=3231044 RepID=UPI003463099C
MILSIIIPVYNTENFIDRCIRSVANQVKEYKDIELVVVDDGSTDGSFQLLEQLKTEYNNIRLFTHKNHGVGYTRNVGIEKAKGQYIWFIDSDDYIDHGFIPKIYETLVNQTPEMILFGYKRVTSEGNEVSVLTYDDKTFTSEELINSSIYSNSVCCKVINASVVTSNKIRFDTGVITAEDFDFSFRSLYFSEKVITISDVGYNYVVNDSSVSNIRSKDHLERLAIDTVKVTENINFFLDLNESDYPGRKKAFKPWVDNFLYGLMFSLFRFKYSVQFIDEIIVSLRRNKNYPIATNSMNKKKKLFMSIANKKTLFLLACRVKRVLK